MTLPNVVAATLVLALFSFCGIEPACAVDDVVFANGFEPVPLLPPRYVSASAGAGVVNLRWTPSQGAASYRIERVRLTDGVFTNTLAANFAPAVVGTSTTPAYVDQSVQLGKDYLYVVVAVGAGGQLSANSEHSCGSPVAAGVSVPEVRPRVYMAFHGAQTLAQGSPAQDAQWAYVRTCLQGIYYNTANFEPPDRIAMWRKLNTRNIFGIRNANGAAEDSDPMFGPSTLTYEETHTADIRLNRDSTVVYTNNPRLWDNITVEELRDVLATYPNANPIVTPENVWRDVYVGYALGNWFDPMTYPGGALSSPGAVAALASAGGTMVECIGGLCGSNGTQGHAFLDVLGRTHANGKALLMFVSHSFNQGDSGWLGQFQHEYQKAGDLGMWQADDIVSIINYNDHYPVLPMTNTDATTPDTVTGMLYWALHQ